MPPQDTGWPRATVNERLLVHLRESWVGQSGPPQGSTQEGIARALGIRSNHVSRAVAILVRGGLVTGDLAWTGSRRPAPVELG